MQQQPQTTSSQLQWQMRASFSLIGAPSATASSPCLNASNEHSAVRIQLGDFCSPDFRSQDFCSWTFDIHRVKRDFCPQDFWFQDDFCSLEFHSPDFWSQRGILFLWLLFPKEDFFQGELLFPGFLFLGLLFPRWLLFPVVLWCPQFFLLDIFSPYFFDILFSKNILCFIPLWNGFILLKIVASQSTRYRLLLKAPSCILNCMLEWRSEILHSSYRKSSQQLQKILSPQSIEVFLLITEHFL